ncbi:hypothetical protein K491DRAFT_315355 [Lophiostoma macrostomum CBS 122681]|uniref:Uncharacterized protein n=1 Tax=Lophiostoma macrostomum CBS 122681 TaxID=1314788 RepID=A0A6A6TE47_9PLEO|nr:hypothetical protein K491DRAFT_315355 [Lophiostoma macrostomum CBS 122681]
MAAARWALQHNARTGLSLEHRVLDRSSIQRLCLDVITHRLWSILYTDMRAVHRRHIREATLAVSAPSIREPVCAALCFTTNIGRNIATRFPQLLVHRKRVSLSHAAGATLSAYPKVFITYIRSIVPSNVSFIFVSISSTRTITRPHINTHITFVAILANLMVLNIHFI